MGTVGLKRCSDYMLFIWLLLVIILSISNCSRPVNVMGKFVMYKTEQGNCSDEVKPLVNFFATYSKNSSFEFSGTKVQEETFMGGGIGGVGIFNYVVEEGKVFVEDGNDTVLFVVNKNMLVWDIDCLKIYYRKNQSQNIRETYKSLSTKYHYMQGLKAFNSGQYDKAIPHFQKCVQINKGWTKPLSYLAQVHFEKAENFKKQDDIEAFLKEIQLSISMLDKVIQINPSDLEALYARAQAYEFKGECERALKDYTKVVDLDPSYSGAKEGMERLENCKETQ